MCANYLFNNFLNFSRNNKFDDVDITRCRFDKNDPINRHCPIFKLGYIFDEIKLKPSALYKVIHCCCFLINNIYFKYTTKSN